MSDQGLNVRLDAKREGDAAHAGTPGLLRLWSALAPPSAGSTQMKEVVAVIRPQRWQATKGRLQRGYLPAFTHQRVLGRGRERGLRYLPRAGAAERTAVRYLPKQMVSWIVEAHQVDGLIHAVMEANRTGAIGDGMIFVLPVESAVRIRTGERGVDALRADRPGDWIAGAVPSEPMRSPDAAGR